MSDLAFATLLPVSALRRPLTHVCTRPTKAVILGSPRRRVWAACAPRADEDATRDDATRDVTAHDVAKHEMNTHDLVTHDVAPHKVGTHDAVTHEVAAHVGEVASDEELEAAAMAAMQDIDHLAEQWIGSNVARWEWYERVKARRQRMASVSKESDEKFDNELQELRRTFREIDAVFGTRMMENDEVSVAGWSTVVVIMLLYIVLGYWGFELIVGFLTSFTGPSAFS